MGWTGRSNPPIRAKASCTKAVFAEHSGYVTAMDTRDIGLSLIGLKGGRTTPDQKLDYATGFSDFCQIGDFVDNTHPLAVIHAQDEASWQRAAQELRRHIHLSESPEASKDIIIQKIS